ncbi:MAG: TldD/PmbA family protein [Candidatus Thorarchaeota archaeon]|jgi:TldD protein
MLDLMTNAIESVSDKKVAFADIRQESRVGTQLAVINGALRRFNRTNRAGTVARVLVGECWGQASTTQEVTKVRLEMLLSEATKMAKACAKYSRNDIDLSNVNSEQKSVWLSVKEDPQDVSTEEKIEFVMTIDKGLKIDDRIVNTNTSYQDGKLVFRLVNTEGARLEWDELRIRAFAYSVAREGDRMHYDYDVVGGLSGYELIRGVDTNEFTERIAQGTLELLSAEKPPSGKMTIIMDGDTSGIIAHEVCGHGSEADEVVKERSFLTGLVGKRVGSDLVTMVDDGTLEGKLGSFPYDSEGTPATKTFIIKDGIFSGYMHTLETAALMGVKPTGNGRAQDYNRRIFARMSNTFFGPGEWSIDEMISDTKDGLYILKPMSGMEDVVGGGVQVSCLKGYVIKNGEKQQLVRSNTLAGKVLDILSTVDAVGKDMHFSGGTCGKGEEDWVSVTSGGPHMRAELIVGGG